MEEERLGQVSSRSLHSLLLALNQLEPISLPVTPQQRTHIQTVSHPIPPIFSFPYSFLRMSIQSVTLDRLLLSFTRLHFAFYI